MKALADQRSRFEALTKPGLGAAAGLEENLVCRLWVRVKFVWYITLHEMGLFTAGVLCIENNDLVSLVAILLPHRDNEDSQKHFGRFG